MGFFASLVYRGRKLFVGEPVVTTAEEAELFVTGRYRQLLERRHQQVPAWAWLNELSHGDLHMVERAAGRASSAGPDAFVAELANDMLREVYAGRASLEDLQRRRLIPLELALAESHPWRMPGTAAELARAIHLAIVGGLVPIAAEAPASDGPYRASPGGAGREPQLDRAEEARRRNRR